MASGEQQSKQLPAPNDWENLWDVGHIPFHLSNVHSYLEKYFPLLTNGRTNLNILFPLCGKDVSIRWIAEQGHRVVGIEFCPVAVKQFFAENNLEFTEETIENFSIFKSKDGKIHIYCGDMFLFSSVYKEKFDCVWDRASLVAVNPEDRKKYIEVVKAVTTPSTRYLFISHDYDQSKMEGPPFSITIDDTHALFGECSLQKLDERDIIHLFSKERRQELQYMGEVAYLLQFNEGGNPQADRQVSAEEWKEKWDAKRIGFHRTNVHDTLITHATTLTKGRTDLKIFVPLCGKSWDMKWLADQGHIVVGVEIAPLAIQEFFQEQQVEYTEEKLENFTLYKSKDERILIYCGDLFNFTQQYHGKFDAIWDRASLVAINPGDREKYAQLMHELLSPDGKYLLVVIYYNPSELKGPPFSVSADTVHKLYSEKFSLQWLETVEREHSWKGVGVVTDQTCLLTPKQ